ncbi:MAG: flagellar hook-length control protein FliK [Syntrophaceae bacterium]|nr:flagellar hook-length control protein FliK [Syntrophaceae bacterium]
MAVNQITGIPVQLLIRSIQQKLAFHNLPDLKVGDKVEATVTEKLGESRVLILLNGTQLEADTTLPLQVGQKIRVQVENLQPQILLRLIAGEPESTPEILTGFLKVYRSNPQALTELFQAGGPLLDPETLKTISSTQLREQSQTLAKMFRTLIFSKETIGNPFFIKDFVNRSGLALEHTLAKMVQENISLKVRDPVDAGNLKSGLLKLGAEIREWLAAKPDIPQEEVAKLLRLAEFSERSVHTLETQQALNVLSRDQDNRFMIQIPFAFPHSMTMQDIFIEFDGNRQTDREEGAPFRVVLFLNLDRLGEMMVDVGIRGEDLTADLSCQKVDTMSLVTARLDALKENLASLGFRVVRMTCELRDDIVSARNDYVRNTSLYNSGVINFFA